MQMKAMIHSRQDYGTIEQIRMLDVNKFLVRTDEGKLCTAIFNYFNGLYYADDVFGLIDECIPD